MKVTLAHHWLTNFRGGEKVLEQIALMLPDSDIYTLIRNQEIHIPGLDGHQIHTSILNRLPGVTKLYRHLLPIHPWAINRMRIPTDTDLLLSTDASLFKAISLPPSTTHVCYCHSPPRYLWGLGAEYKRTSRAARLGLDRVVGRLREFDHRAAQRVTHFIANSKFVADRIEQYYQRESKVIYPPVATANFRHDRQRESFHLVLSELTSYKRIDLAVDAYNRLGLPLVIIGDGPERGKLQKRANSNIRFLGRQPSEAVRNHFETCAAFIFPGIEDFGITPVEAQAAGSPVIAFRKGGALETVVEGKTGMFFDEQTPDCLADAVRGFDPHSISSSECRDNAEKFSTAKFQRALSDFLEEVMGAAVLHHPIGIQGEDGAE